MEVIITTPNYQQQDQEIGGVELGGEIGSIDKEPTNYQLVTRMSGGAVQRKPTN